MLVDSFFYFKHDYVHVLDKIVPRLFLLIQDVWEDLFRKIFQKVIQEYLKN